ncbi:MAG: hypothetical protein K2X87_12415 [Gemmataceae bacterium]|nr:hypothetical protein [Gemmataceae bacterium]
MPAADGVRESATHTPNERATMAKKVTAQEEPAQVLSALEYRVLGCYIDDDHLDISLKLVKAPFEDRETPFEIDLLASPDLLGIIAVYADAASKRLGEALEAGRRKDDEARKPTRKKPGG